LSGGVGSIVVVEAIVDRTAKVEIGWLCGKFNASGLEKSQLAFSAWALMGRKEGS